MSSYHIYKTQLHGNVHYSSTPTRAAVIGAALIIGQSNGNGTIADAPYSSASIATSHPGLTCTFRDKGNNLTTYGANDTGPVPYLFNLMGTETSSPIIIRRSVNGSGEVGVRETQLPGALLDLSALSLTAADIKLVWLIHGEEDSTSEAQALAYRASALERICRMYESSFPNALLAINYLASTTYGDHYAIVRTAQVEAASRRPNRKLVRTTDSPAVVVSGDGVHYAAGSTGQGRSADKMWAAIAS